MAFTIGAWAATLINPFQVGRGETGLQPPTITYRFELADQYTTTSPVMQTPSGIAEAKVVLRQKGWGSGTGSIGPIYEVEVAYDSGFTSQVRVIGTAYAQRTGRDQTFVLPGVVPDAQTYTFARILVSLSGTDAVTYDALVEFSPGAPA